MTNQPPVVILPQLGKYAGTPTPSELNAASSRTAAAEMKVAWRSAARPSWGDVPPRPCGDRQPLPNVSSMITGLPPTQAVSIIWSAAGGVPRCRSKRAGDPGKHAVNLGRHRPPSL